MLPHPFQIGPLRQPADGVRLHPSFAYAIGCHPAIFGPIRWLRPLACALPRSAVGLSAAARRTGRANLLAAPLALAGLRLRRSVLRPWRRGAYRLPRRSASAERPSASSAAC